MVIRQQRREDNGMGFSVRSASNLPFQPPLRTEIRKRPSSGFPNSPSPLHLPHPHPQIWMRLILCPFSSSNSHGLCTSASLSPSTVSFAPCLSLVLVYLSITLSRSTFIYLTQNSFLQGTEAPTILYQVTSPCQL